MSRVELTTVADANGVLSLSIPLGKRDAHRQMRVTVEPLPETPALNLSEE